jgi:tRNA dimethylallyltransferase
MQGNSAKIKILVIVGPTASGKSDLAVKLAKKFNGEVVSADSRQVYRCMNIGTGKITKKEMRGIRHHLLDVGDAKKQFTVIEYKKLADEAIADIISRGKLPIICGGTGFYIDALVNDVEFPEVGANLKLRARLKSKSADQLFRTLKKLDPNRAAHMNQSDSKNPRRLIRAIEIASAYNSNKESIKTSGRNKCDAIWIGINPERSELKRRIHKRLLKRLKSGMLTEARRLHKAGLSWKRMDELGLEYRFMSRYLQGKMNRNEMIARLETEIGRYAKRQMTWFRRNHDIHWFSAPDNRLTKLVKRAII